jgi:hypothetical protein
MDYITHMVPHCLTLMDSRRLKRGGRGHHDFVMQRHLPGIKGKDFLATCVVAPSDYDA